MTRAARRRKVQRRWLQRRLRHPASLAPHRHPAPTEAARSALHAVALASPPEPPQGTTAPALAIAPSAPISEANHEAAVAAFFAAAGAADPERFQAVADKFPVLTPAQETYRASRESWLSPTMGESLALAAGMDGRRLSRPADV